MQRGHGVSSWKWWQRWDVVSGVGRMIYENFLLSNLTL